MAARCVLECLRSVKSDEDCYQVLQLMVRLSDDIGENFCTFHDRFVTKITIYGSHNFYNASYHLSENCTHARNS